MVNNNIRFALAAAVILGVNLIGLQAGAQTVEKSRGERSTQPRESQAPAKAQEEATPEPVYVDQVLSTALPSQGRYSNGLQIGTRTQSAPRRAVSSPAVHSSPFNNLSQQLQRARANIQAPQSFLDGPGQGINGRTAARLAISRGVYGNIGLSTIGPGGLGL